MENILLIIAGFFIILIIVGYVNYYNKGMKGIPLYKIYVAELEPLSQVTIITDTSFAALKGKQDKIFESNYFIGKEVLVNDKVFVISRIRRQEQIKIVTTGFSYIVYFEIYENSEFPKTIHLKKHKKIDYLNFSKSGLEIFCHDKSKIVTSWQDTTFNNTLDRIQILNFYIPHKNFYSNEDFTFVEEILIKYAIFKK